MNSTHLSICYLRGNLIWKRVGPLARALSAICAAGFFAVATASATSVIVVNPSFETPNVFADPSHFQYFDALTGTGWQTSAGYTTTIFQPVLAGSYNPGAIPDGIQVATVGRVISGVALPGTLWQDVGAVVGGATYDLDVWVGNRLEPSILDSTQYTISLLAGTTVMGSLQGIIGDVTNGGFAQRQLTVAAAPQYDGQTLRIQLYASGFQASFDNVQLSEHTPEPATLALFALGGGLLLLRARRKRVVR